MAVETFYEKSSQSFDLLKTLSVEKNRRFVSNERQG